MFAWLVFNAILKKVSVFQKKASIMVLKIRVQPPWTPERPPAAAEFHAYKYGRWGSQHELDESNATALWEAVRSLRFLNESRRRQHQLKNYSIIFCILNEKKNIWLGVDFPYNPYCCGDETYSVDS